MVGDAVSVKSDGKNSRKSIMEIIKLVVWFKVIPGNARRCLLKKSLVHFFNSFFKSSALENLYHFTLLQSLSLNRFRSSQTDN